MNRPALRRVKAGRYLFRCGLVRAGSHLFVGVPDGRVDDLGQPRRIVGPTFGNDLAYSIVLSEENAALQLVIEVPAPVGAPRTSGERRGVNLVPILLLSRAGRRTAFQDRLTNARNVEIHSCAPQNRTPERA